jgi:hypothetical protein
MMIDLGEHWDYIECIARERLRHNVTSRHVSVYGDTIEVIGAAGELAARRFYGMPTVLGTYFDGGTDFTFRHLKFDVKATVWTLKIQFRSLQWPIWKPVKADVILFSAINIEKQTAILLGCATRNEIISAFINSTRYIACHEIPIQNLHPVMDYMLTPYPKKKRLVTEDFSRMILSRDGVCLYGLSRRDGCSDGNDAHHIKTRGSGGDDVFENGIILCRKHHNMAHSGQITVRELQKILSSYYKYHYEA